MIEKKRVAEPRETVAELMAHGVRQVADRAAVSTLNQRERIWDPD